MKRGLHRCGNLELVSRSHLVLCENLTLINHVTAYTRNCLFTEAYLPPGSGIGSPFGMRFLLATLPTASRCRMMGSSI